MFRSTPSRSANRTSRRLRQSKVMRRPLAAALALLGGAALSATQPSAPNADAAFSNFFHARTAQEAGAASDQIVASGVGFDEAFARLKQGRVYARDVPRGVVQGSYRTGTDEYFYTLDVRRPTTRRTNTRSACSFMAASAASRRARVRVPDRTAGCPALNRSTSCRRRGGTRRGGADARSRTFARFSTW